MANKYDPILGAYRQADTVDLSGYVPYTGAITNVDLGSNGLVANEITISTLTQGSVLFASSSGLVSQDNANFFWDDTNKRLGIGRVPLVQLDVYKVSNNSAPSRLHQNYLELTGSSYDIITYSGSNFLYDNRQYLQIGEFPTDRQVAMQNWFERRTTATGNSLSIEYYGLDNVCADKGAYTLNDFAFSSVSMYGARSALTINPKIEGGTSLDYTAIGNDVSIGNSPTLTSGTYSLTVYGSRVVGSGTTTGTTTGYGFFTSLSGFDTNWGFYNSSTSNNYLGTGTTSIGTTTQSAGLSIVRTSEQLRVGYSTALYWNAVTAVSTGINTFTATGGTSPKFVYASPVDLRTGTATANTYPLKFTSGALLTTPVVGVKEFLTDKFYGTITTGTARKEFIMGDNAITEGVNLVFGTTTGTKIGTATTQKISLWNATPIVQPTTAVASSTYTHVASTAIHTDSTFDGYTIGQIVKALRNFGLLQ